MQDTNNSPGASSGRWFFIQLPLTDYVAAWNLQKELVAAKAEKEIEEDVVLCLEHPPVFTLGRRGGAESLKVSGDFLERKSIPIIEVERGGDITYHGPGQLVVYPIVSLERAGMGIGEFMTALEEVMLETVAAFGLTAERSSLNRGIWIENKKLGSVGICIRRGIAFHGLALNVNVSLEPFEWINPCGLRSIGVTSLERELPHEISMGRVREVVRQSIEKVFSVQLLDIQPSELNRHVKTKDN